jgi:hypothetical protein
MEKKFEEKNVLPSTNSDMVESYHAHTDEDDLLLEKDYQEESENDTPQVIGQGFVYRESISV